MDVKTKVWIVGKWKEPWSFQGVYTTEEKAVAACAGPNYFVGPAWLDEPVPDKDMVWPGAYYPKGKSCPEKEEP